MPHSAHELSNPSREERGRETESSCQEQSGIFHSCDGCTVQRWCAKLCDSSHVSIINLIMNFKEFQAWRDYEDRHDGVRLHRLCKGTIGMYHTGFPARPLGCPSGWPSPADPLPDELVPRHDQGLPLDPGTKAPLDPDRSAVSQHGLKVMPTYGIRSSCP